MVSAQMPLSPPVRTPVIRTPVEVRWPVIGPAVVDRPVVRGSVVRAPVGRVAIAVISRVTIAVVGGAGRCREPQDASGNRAGRDGATVIRSPPAPTITTVSPAVPPPVNILGWSSARHLLNRGHGQGHALRGRRRSGDDGCGEQAWRHHPGEGMSTHGLFSVPSNPHLS